MAVAAWTHPPGTPVLVLRANGTIFHTVTDSEAFLLDGQHALIQIRGLSGNTSLRRVYMPAVRSGPL